MGQKVEVGPLSLDDYRRVFESVCFSRGMVADDSAFDRLLQMHRQDGKRPLLACYPRDLINLATSRAIFLGVEPQPSAELMSWAWHVYFGSPDAPAP